MKSQLLYQLSYGRTQGRLPKRAPETRQAKIGEPDRIRTCDPVIKSHLLYQLSYGPTQKGNTTHRVFARKLAIRHYRVNGYFVEKE